MFNKYRIIYLPAFDGYVAQKRSCLFWWRCIGVAPDVNYGEDGAPLWIARELPRFYKCYNLSDATKVIEKNKTIYRKERVIWEGD